GVGVEACRLQSAAVEPEDDVRIARPKQPRTDLRPDAVRRRKPRDEDAGWVEQLAVRGDARCVDAAAPPGVPGEKKLAAVAGNRGNARFVVRRAVEGRGEGALGRNCRC